MADAAPTDAAGGRTGDRPPVLLRSLSAAVLADGLGDLRLPREARGAIDDWGGVYAQLVRLTGPWRIELFDGRTAFGLPETCTTAGRTAERWISEHRLGRIGLRHEVAPTERPPGAVRRLRLSLTEGPSTRLVVHSAFVPHLLPTMVEGIRPTSFRLETSERGLSIRQRGFGLLVRHSVPPCRLTLNRGSWLGGRWSGPVSEVGADHEVELVPGTDVELRWALFGGLFRELDRFDSLAENLVRDPEPELARQAEAEQRWQAGTPTVRMPDAPELERAYVQARSGLRRLYSAPGDDLTGLVAGYPWYGSLWCRDLAWMLPAVLWLGDFEWAAATLATVFRFQSRARIPVLGGEVGELPMQISPGPVFLFGTSDTTLYYPELVARFLRHSGDGAATGRWQPALREVVTWGLARSDPGTGLVRNGGEAEAIRDATGSLARVRYGIDSPDTTIWDSADRREHAIDVQVLWLRALRAVAALDPEAARELSLPDRADRLAAAIPRLYDWPEERFLVDSLRGGMPVRRLRPNALRAVSAGLFEPARAAAIVRRAAEDDLLTPWGTRTLSSTDPGYRPAAYHDGQVWTLATLWSADAAFSAGEEALGFDLLRRVAARYAAEDGGANECYRGDRAEPYDSCFLLGLSLGPFLSVLFERVWGLSLDARGPRLDVRPRFPTHWRSAAIENLRVGAGRVSLRYRAPVLEARWRGPLPLELRTPAGSARIADGASKEFRWDGVAPPGPSPEPS